MIDVRKNELGVEAEAKIEAIQTMKLSSEKELFHRFLHPSLRKHFEAPRRCGVKLKSAEPSKSSSKGLEILCQLENPRHRKANCSLITERLYIDVKQD